LDVHVEFLELEFSSVLPYIESGKALLGNGSIIVTDERKESVDFIEYFPAAFVLVVRAEEKDNEIIDFLDSIKDGFEKNFIRESRWKLFRVGILVTLLITVLSIIFGTLLGFIVFLLCKEGNPVANTVTRFSVWLLHGMPMVVLLMILYYIIFRSLNISGIVVSVIAFTLTFGSSVYGLLKMGVGAVDKGQYEAAYALGYSVKHTFFRIILPQALPHVMSSYRGQVVALLKATAIVGYIAVQDITKVGDIVRSRTYDAFFPLIAIAVIYFVMEGLLGFLIKRIHLRMDPKRRKPEDILKGVDVHDKD
ncbi:MAG: ABC transporter permease subunit, partial [Lachnospiraceae bacterium]|nr:ABC transporter permease subunit [Lachnospiraceae bacterium]